MISHAEQRIVPYSPQQMYMLVADIARYPEFLPWCLETKIIRATPHEVIADLAAGYGFMRERFRSKVLLDPERCLIDVDYLSGPLKHLDTIWQFSPHPDGGCVIDFKVVFEFRSKLLQNMAMVFFNEVVKRMVSSFEKRAAEVYAG